MKKKLDVLNMKDLEKIEVASLEYCNVKYNNQITSIDWVNLNQVIDMLQKINIDKSDYLKEKIYYNQHGLRHHLRVQLYSYILLKYLNYDIQDIELMNYICAIHDTQRKNNYKDTAHGLLAYDKFVKNNDAFANDVKNLIKKVLEEHDSKITYTDNLYLMVLKCADALDRFRLRNLGGWINFDRVPLSDKEELKILREKSKQLVMVCRKLTIQTEKDRLLYPEKKDFDIIVKSLNLIIKEDNRNEKDVNRSK